MYDLLKPTQLQEHYIHQIRQTLDAYDATQVVIGEALQNSLDAIIAADDPQPHRIDICINFDQRSVSVVDDGIGFPNDPQLLFLGGSKKAKSRNRFFGLVGVGIKVVLFHSAKFVLRAKDQHGDFRFELQNAYTFENDDTPDLKVPRSFERDPDPRAKQGTELNYSFPKGTANDPLIDFVSHIKETCLPIGPDKSFGKTLSRSTKSGKFKNRFSCLIASYLRRFTYLGNVSALLGGKPELANTSVFVKVTASDPQVQLNELGMLFDGDTCAEVELMPSYLTVEEVSEWLPPPSFGMFEEKLGKGGTNLEITANGFNQLIFVGEEDYERLLINKRGVLGICAQDYRKKLFPSINGIVLTIGRIPLFEKVLPGGSRRIISANGVVTTHELALEKGRNQEYVRCFDLVVDVDATLNYGKAQITDNHLVGLVRRFVNDAYRLTIQNGAGNWVGKLPPDEVEHDFFLKREDLALPDWASQKVPRDENDVIGLFFEAIGRGRLSGYRIFGLSQRDRYDCRAVIRPIGQQEYPPNPPDDRQLSTIEFKVEAASLVRDLERGAKFARDMALLVAWSEGTHSSPKYAFADIEHSKHYPEKVVPGVTRYLADSKSGAEIQVLLLEQLLADSRRLDS